MSSEAERVQRYRETGDRRWFEELYRGSRRRVFGVCMKILRNPQRAEDACHEAFLRAYERFPSLRGDNFSSWTSRIAANLCYDELRRRAREGAGERDWDRDPAPEGEGGLGAAGRVQGGVEQGAISREELARAISIVRALEPHQRSVFLLKHLESKSYLEIQAITGFTAKQVKSYLQNARRNVGLAWKREQGSVRETASLGGSPS